MAIGDSSSPITAAVACELAKAKVPAVHNEVPPQSQIDESVDHKAQHGRGKHLDKGEVHNAA